MVHIQCYLMSLGLESESHDTTTQQHTDPVGNLRYLLSTGIVLCSCQSSLRSLQVTNLSKRKGILTKDAAKAMSRGMEATARRYRQPRTGIMNIDTDTMKHVPPAQKNCNVQ